MLFSYGFSRKEYYVGTHRKMLHTESSMPQISYAFLTKNSYLKFKSGINVGTIMFPEAKMSADRE